MRFDLSQSGLKSVITAGIFSLVAIGILFNWAVPASAQNAAPAKPDTPTLRALDKGMVEVDWNDVSGANRYEVQFYTSSGWIDLPNAGLGIEIFFDGSRAEATGLPADLGYDAFHVRAGNSVGWSEWSEYAWQMTTHNMDWEGIPATGAPTISGTAQVGETLTAETSGIADADGLTNVSYRYQWIRNNGSSDTDIEYATRRTYTLVAAHEEQTIKVKVSFIDDEGNEETLTSAATDAVAPVPCPGADYNPTPTDVEVDAVPIVVTSTTDDYFVLYVSPREVELPVLVKRGEAGTTTLAENVEALPAERYRVEKYLIADPADVDGDCIDDITELDDFGTNNPVNAASSPGLNDGAVGIPDRAAFEVLARNGKNMKFVVFGLHTRSPRMYFQNTNTHPTTHDTFLEVILDEGLEQDLVGVTHGYIDYHPSLEAADGSPGVYVAWDTRTLSFRDVSILHTLLAANMLLLEQDLVYLFKNDQLLQIQHELRRYETSRIPLVFDYDLWPEADFVPLNEEVGFGLLRVLEPDERPSLRDVVIYETLPNNLPRVAGIISTVPQTPLSHVNLRAIQDGVPNAFIRDALDNEDIESLIGGYVRYAVNETRYSIRAATREEVDAHYDSSRPSQPQTPQRDLSVTEITQLSEIGFDDWDAFGVKAANVAVLRTLGFPEGTIPDGFAIPFYFYDEFMKHNDFYTRIETMLADADFQENFDTQDEELKDLRDAIEDGETPAWILTALADMNTGFPEGTTNRKYRSSTNNEDLPGFNGAGLYDSKSQKPDEDEEDGLDKSLKEVYASLWNFRAFTERDFHRIDHLTAAMGILVHPSYQDELVNGVAVSFDPIGGVREGDYYVNSQLGEDLVTNPDANSVPEELVLYLNQDGRYRILATSNQVAPGKLLMSNVQIGQLRRHLKVIHDHFAGLYNPAADEPFAMEIEFKITSENKLAIKQARPWVFSGAATPAPGKTLPSAPINLAVAPGDTSLTVVWDLPANTGGESPTAYDVRYIMTSEDETDDANWTEQLGAWTESSGVRSYTITGLETGVEYDVQVRAENSVGKGPWSATEAGTPQEADVPSVTANFEQSSYNVTEGGDVSIAVTLSADPERSVAIPITTTNQGTATDADYSGVPLEVTFQSGDTEVTFTFTATDDPVDDDGEWVKVTFGALPAGVSEGTTTEATVSITDNDVSGVTVSETALTVPEGGTAGETYTVVLDSPPTADVVVTVAGHAGTEVTPSSTSLTFTTSNWNDAHTVTVKAGDDADTLDDTVTLTHSAASTDSNYEGITIGNVTVTVNDDDTTNTPATGAPTIRGTVQVGETLTAYTAGITDDDGLNNVSYGYQWIRNDGTSDTEIQDATGETYPLVDADEGKTIKVKVSFTDDADNEEALTSTATAEVAAAAPTEPPGRPRNLTGAANADGTVTLSWDAPNDDTVTGYQILRRKPREGEKTLLVHVNDTGSTATQHTDRDVTPDVGHAYRVKAINAVGLSRWSNFVNVTPVQPAEPAQNSPATGQPIISGTVQVGETLTANTSGIADYDGLINVSYSHQWIRNDGTSDTDITDATRSSYTLVDADEGQILKVRVSFTDDVGHDETLTSAATGEVEALPNRPATGAPSISGTAQVGETLTADTSGIADADGLTNVSYSYQWVAGGTDIGGATGSTYTVTASEQGETIQVRVSFTDDAGNQESLTSAATEAVAAKPNTSATGRPTIGGTAQVGETLTADTTGIGDADGLTNVFYSYQWVAGGTDLGGATGSTYALTAGEQGKTIRVRVSFTDDAGNRETLTSAATDEVAAKPNSPATGQPIISGTVRVGDMLTADTSGIADADGLDNVSYRYQWVRNDGSSDTGITDATASAYTLVDADEGQTLKVRVTFTDDVGHDETLTSASTAAIAAEDPQSQEPPAKPTGLTATVSHDSVSLTWDDPGDESITGYQMLRRDRALHAIGEFLVHVDDTGNANTTFTDNDVEPSVQYVYRIKAKNNAGLSELSEWVRANMPAPTRDPNSPATGVPTVTGTAQVGEVLTADTSGIADADGLENATFSYQWIRNDGSTETDIQDATGSIYTLVDADEGQTIKVKVSFTDDAGNEETLTSTATGSVAARPNTSATGRPTISGPARVGDTLTADTTGIADADGLTNVSYSYQWVANDGTSDADIGGATGSTYMLTASEQGQTIQVRVSFTDDAGNEEALTSAATEAVAAKPNSLATGEPSISGTARVGDTLTVDTSGIADADGLENATFSYQWIGNDGSSDTDIAGATDSGYMLVAGDVGQTIQVRVSFTDDAGNETTLTSAATEAVAARPNTSATGRPSISGTVRVGEVLTADTSGIADDDGLTNVSYGYQWVAGGTDLGGATGSTYTLTASEQGKTIRVRVSFTDDAGNQESLTSAATDEVAVRPNTSATGLPTISGTARVGETLTVDTSGIADADGLDNVSYRYQWVVTDRGAYFDISGETGATYTLVAADRGLYIQVRVSFTDDAGKRATLTSALTDVVAAAP